MKSRSNWLKHTREYSKQTNSGRKYFMVHKNHHSPDLLQDSSFASVNLNSSQLIKQQNNSLLISPKPRTYSKSPLLNALDEKVFLQQLKKKDSELQLLRKLYNETNKKLKSFETFKKFQENSLIKLPELSFTRNKSSQNYKPDSFLEVSNNPFHQPRFPKNRPKLFSNNPITGCKSPTLRYN